jgi:PleD family two-component response regulator
LNLSQNDRPIATGVSIGIASADQSVGGFETLLGTADSALYEAKRAGRGRYVFAEAAATAECAALSAL